MGVEEATAGAVAGGPAVAGPGGEAPGGAPGVATVAFPSQPTDPTDKQMPSAAHAVSGPRRRDEAGAANSGETNFTASRAEWDTAGEKTQRGPEARREQAGFPPPHLPRSARGSIIR
ncbi:MAG: hypothetical protein AAF907_16350 [Planctomycetota bacterium]